MGKEGMMPHGFYILDADHVPVEASDMAAWDNWHSELGNRIVGHEYSADGSLAVSTVFLFFDHAWGDGPPEWFETMIFGGARCEEYQERYATWDEAVAGHARAVALWKATRKHWLKRFACALIPRIVWK